MAEKGGLEAQNLINEYNVAGALEIFMNDKWVRVISKDFRAFNGPRRITQPQYTEHRNVNVPMMTYEYFGPVFTWGTNNVIDYSDTGSLEKGKVWDKARKISKDRG